MSMTKFHELKEMEKRITSSEGRANRIYELPVSKITIVGVTGRANRTARKQVMINVQFNGRVIPLIFVVYKNIETEILVGCDNLRKYETIIDLETNQVVFTLSLIHI